MDFRRDWTQFAVDAEVEAHGTGRLVKAHNAEVMRLVAKIANLQAALQKIDGGDDPCHDEAKLRQWAYEALTLDGNPPR